MKKFYFLFFIYVLFSNVVITDVSAVYTIKSNGVVHVVENYTYLLSEKNYHEVYISRNVPLLNYSGRCLNKNCSFFYSPSFSSISGGDELILRFDVPTTGKIMTSYEYDIKPLILQKDCVQFFYKLEEIPNTANLNLFINLPGSINKTKYFIHNDYEYNLQEYKNIIEISSKTDFLEINMIMPINWFSKDNLIIKKEYSKSDIISAEEEDAFIRVIRSLFNKLVFISPILYVLFIIVLWFVFGREISASDLNYFNEYEYTPPTDVYRSLFFVSSGKIDFPRAFTTCLFSLVNKNALEIKDDRTIHIKNKPHTLNKWEEYIYDLLKEYDGQSISKIISKKSVVLKIESWAENMEEEIKKEDYYDLRIYYLAVAVGAIMVLFFWLAYFFSPVSVVASFIIFLILSIVRMNKMWLGKWNKKGRLLYLKVNAFKKYLSDFTLLKERPPSSIKLWEEFLVYAVALGVAENVYKVIKEINPAILKQTRMPSYHIYGLMYSSYPFMHAKVKSSSFGYGGISAGGFGGGFGGGSAGAR